MSDSNGFIWIGTVDGLNRFDGLSFKALRHAEKDSFSIPTNCIVSIVEDPDKENIWISTTEGFVSRVNKTSLSSVNFKPGKKTGLTGDVVMNIFFDRKGNLWLCVLEKGLYSYDKKKNTFSHVLSLNDTSSYYRNELKKKYDFHCNSIQDIAESENGLFWLATSDGLYKFDPSTRIAHSIRAQSITSPDHIYDQLFQGIIYGNDGVWMGSRSSGLWHFNTKTGVWQNFKISSNSSANVNIIRSLAWKSDTQIWIASNDAGFGFFDITEQAFHFEDHRRTEVAEQMIRDKDGIIWFSTIKGLNKFDPNQEIAFNRITVEKSDNGSFYVTRGYYFDHKKNKLFIGTIWADGLHIISKSTNKTTIVKFPINHNELNQFWITDILNDSEDNLWVLTRDDLFICNKETNELVSFTKSHQRDSHFFSMLYESSNGTIWIGSHRDGLFKLNRSDGSMIQFRHINDPNSILAGTIRSISENKNGDLYIGTNNGLSVFRLKTERFVNYQYKNVTNAVPTNNISGSTVTSNHKIWLSTLGSGLLQCDEVDGKISFTRINSNGIKSDFIYSITTGKKGKNVDTNSNQYYCT